MSFDNIIDNQHVIVRLRDQFFMIIARPGDKDAGKTVREVANVPGVLAVQRLTVDGTAYWALPL